MHRRLLPAYAQGAKKHREILCVRNAPQLSPGRGRVRAPAVGLPVCYGDDHQRHTVSCGSRFNRQVYAAEEVRAAQGRTKLFKTRRHGLYEEPAAYGPFRLIDTVGRVLAIMEAHGLADPFLAQLRDTVDAERSGSSSRDELRSTLDELCLQYAAELKTRTQRWEEEE